MGSRSYRQTCSVSKALDLVGERWTLLIVRDLLPGPLGYSALLEGLPGLTTNLLAKRLKDLTAAGILEKRPAPAGDKAKALYALTPAGEALGPIIGALAAWGKEHGPKPVATDSLNFRWMLILFARHYRPGGTRWIVQLDCNGKSLQLRLGTPKFEGHEGTPMTPDLVISADAATYYELLFSDTDPTGLLDSGAVTLTAGSAGEPPLTIWKDFIESFQLNQPAPSPTK